MPWAPPKPCAWAGCGKLTKGRYCDTHQVAADERDRERRAKLDAERGSAARRGYDAEWRRVRSEHLRMEPLCRFCKKEGRVREATVVDHITTISERPDLRLDHANLRSLCKPCHDARTARDQGWGRRRRGGGFDP